MNLKRDWRKLQEHRCNNERVCFLPRTRQQAPGWFCVRSVLQFTDFVRFHQDAAMWQIFWCFYWVILCDSLTELLLAFRQSIVISIHFCFKCSFCSKKPYYRFISADLFTCQYYHVLVMYYQCCMGTLPRCVLRKERASANSEGLTLCTNKTCMQPVFWIILNKFRIKWREAKRCLAF